MRLIWRETKKDNKISLSSAKKLNSEGWDRRDDYQEDKIKEEYDKLQDNIKIERKLRMAGKNGRQRIMEDPRLNESTKIADRLVMIIVIDITVKKPPNLEFYGPIFMGKVKIAKKPYGFHSVNF